jgi:DNA-binding response OmpR family regulator
MRILIIEDDSALGLFLTKGLQLEGHEVFLAADGEAGLEHALEHVPDLMVLDLGLPRKDGVQVLEQMHGRFAETSVLVLTGRSSVEDRVKCLNLGADDCLLKPFSLSELMARCRALIRRRVQFADPNLRIGDLELNRMERSVRRDGRPVDLTTKEFALLEYLMQARGRTCARAELLREVWQATPSAGTNVVDVYVNYLRKKLAAVRLKNFDGELEADNIIETVRGEGYALAPGMGRKLPSSVFPDGVPAHLGSNMGSARREGRADGRPSGLMGDGVWGIRAPARA